MNKSLRNILISIFVLTWLFLFNYESVRAFYLNPLFKRDLPKTKFLFPPAGWIMFFNVGDGFGTVEVYGLREGRAPQLIDPHAIFQTRQIGYDNIHRGALFAFSSMRAKPQTCAFLHRKFPYFQQFAVMYVQYPSIVKNPMEQERFVIYQCE